MAQASNRNRNIIIGSVAVVLVIVLYSLFSGGGGAPTDVAPATEQSG